MHTLFWIVVFVSTGSYNGGTVSQLDLRLESEAACRAIIDQIDDLWGRTTASCVRVEGEVDG